MRASSIYPGGPERASGDPLTDGAEVRAARRMLARRVLVGVWARRRGELLQGLDDGPEQFDTHAEYAAARELEEWGCDPFEEE